MALKPQFNEVLDSVEYFMFSTGERGGIVFATSGSAPRGSIMDNTNRRVEYPLTGIPSAPSGRIPVGLLMNDVVNIDQSRQYVNPYKDECQIGNKVRLMKKGTVVTNYIAPGAASGLAMPATGYAGSSGFLFTGAGYAGSGWAAVGKFLSNVDSEGYAQFQVEL